MRTYLDHNATSPLRPEARAAMEAALDFAANPSSVHREGQRARGMVETARDQVADALGCSREQIVFTSGGTEAGNLAIAGAVAAHGVRRIVVSAVEHPAVLESARGTGLTVEVAPVTSEGVVDLGALERIVAEGGGEATLVAVMAANNETGAIQPVGEVVQIAHAHGALVYCDAVQAFGKTAFDPVSLGVDMAAVSGHKIGAPQGTGALYVKPGAEPAPLIRGGGQERGLRGGTENVAGLAGLGAAAKAARAALDADTVRIGDLRARLEAAVLEATPAAHILASGAPRLVNTATLAFPGARAEMLVIALDLAGIAVSAGAACSSGKVGSSHVMTAMGLGDGGDIATIRVSLGWNTTADDVDAFVAEWAREAPAVVERVAA